MDRLQVGKKGEHLAANYLVEQGYIILCRNYRCSLGEIDIVARAEGELIFVEVRTKSSKRFGSPAESITAQKVRKVRRVAEHYLMTELKDKRRLNNDAVGIRFDFIGVALKDSQNPEIEHLKGVF